MAKPAFIYAFDNLGPERFTELCGLLLGGKYKGFLLGDTGPDGGVDAEVGPQLGVLQPETVGSIETTIVRPGEKIVFQFKHKTVARTGGQVQARKELLRLFTCTEKNKCELCRRLVLEKRPTTYILVTNVEVNSIFRNKFVKQCQVYHPEIKSFQLIGLDELETWITAEINLRHLYFPTIFGSPQFALKIQLSEGYADIYDDGTLLHYGPQNKNDPPSDALNHIDLLQVSVLNIGTATSYVHSIAFKSIIDGKQDFTFWENSFQIIPEIKVLKNPDFGTALNVGRRQTYSFPFSILGNIKNKGVDVFPSEVLVYDEIGNIYSTPIMEELRSKILGA